VASIFASEVIVVQKQMYVVRKQSSPFLDMLTMYCTTDCLTFVKSCALFGIWNSSYSFTHCFG